MSTLRLVEIGTYAINPDQVALVALQTADNGIEYVMISLMNGHGIMLDASQFSYADVVRKLQDLFRN